MPTTNTPSKSSSFVNPPPPSHRRTLRFPIALPPSPRNDSGTKVNTRAVTAPRRLSVQRRNNNHPASTDRARARARELANEAPLQVAARRPPSNTTSSSRPSRTSSWSGSFGRCPWRSALSTGDSRLRTLEKAYLFGSKRLRWLGGRRAEGAEKSTAMMVDGETDPGKSGKEQKHNLFRIL